MKLEISINLCFSCGKLFTLASVNYRYFSDVLRMVRCCILPGTVQYRHLVIASFFGFKILNFNIFGGFQKKMDIFGGYEDFVDIFGGHHKIGLYLGFFSMHLRVFS